ncbi:N-acetylmuramoyl-L-alanine amidase [Mangrovitalea sediminis]|uniref:N-acetylmuramoyl-L-alanine amidase n=1 Tax=Mangrovitalea sediminis TaxID=1982043 RepID=UPI000BE574C0|nr:N-acetylmuramoyl-L-alanine amidase [Mangrovitalea sediminis]
MGPFDHDEVRRRFLKRLFEASGAVTVASLFPSRVLAAEATAVVHGMHVSKVGDDATLTLDLSGVADHHIFALPNPNRLVIDLSRTGIRQGVTPSMVQGGVVKDVRYARRHGNDLRVVLDLDRSVHASAVMLQPGGGFPYYRLVVDLNASGRAVPVAPTQPAQPVMTAQDHSGHLRDVVVVIDPGHGGKDPGAIGKHGTFEKDVVLAMGHRLHKLLNAEKGVRAVMTRDSDFFIPLYHRVQIAHHHKADLFVSIHADASTDRRVTGSSVYILSEHGASSVMARRLAERENRSDLIGGVKLNGKSDTLASVLLDLSQTGTLEASANLASDMLKRLDPVAGVLSDRVERAAFAVLKSPDIPSALVETAFISNPQEERRLRSPAFQHEIATALHKGIRAYFDEYAPPGTLLAEMNQKRSVIG